MSKIYSTDSYLFDLNPVFAFTRRIIIKVFRFVKKISSDLYNSDLEVGLIEFLIQIPVFLFILFFGFFIAIALINKTEPEKGYRFASILTTSMSPSIKPGSMIFLAPPTDIRVGDVVSFNERSSQTKELTGRRLTHRIVQVISDQNGINYFVTKGDANVQPDPGYLEIDEVSGKMILNIPYLGYVSYLSITNWGLVLFLIIPGGLLVYSEAKIVIKHFKPTK